LLGNFSSFVFDYSVRQKIGGTNMAHFITKQLPVIAPFQYYNRSEFNIFNPSLLEWIGRRVLELVYTSWDIDSLADWCIYHGPPFKWNPQRREALKAELDALFFHFYLGDNKKWAGASSILTKKFNSPRPYTSVTS
jgi:hypothetical protein